MNNKFFHFLRGLYAVIGAGSKRNNSVSVKQQKMVMLFIFLSYRHEDLDN